MHVIIPLLTSINIFLSLSQLSLFSKPLIVNSPFPNVAPFQKQVKSYQTGREDIYLSNSNYLIMYSPYYSDWFNLFAITV